MSAIDDYKQLLEAYPNANKFLSALKSSVMQHMPTQEEIDYMKDFRNLRDPSKYDINRELNKAFNFGPSNLASGLAGVIKQKIPNETVKAYKLFKTKESDPETLYPLFVNADKPVPMQEWVEAEAGIPATGKESTHVSSLLGPLAYRPGWHGGDLPIATHIGKGGKPPVYRPYEHQWAEVEFPNDVDWQSIANERGINSKGVLIPKYAHITDQIPEGGFYRYKTSPNMTGNWLIGGSMKVNNPISDEVVKQINEASGLGIQDLPRFPEFIQKYVENPDQISTVVNAQAGKKELINMLKNSNDKDLQNTIDLIKHVSDPETYNQVMKQFEKINKQKYAQGGHVEINHDTINDIMQQFENEYGLRPDGSEKGRGYLNELKRPDGGVMTEYSIGLPVEGVEMDVPTLVPTLNIEEIKTLLNLPERGRIPESIVKKAAEHAEKRVKSGKSVWATPEESEYGER